MLNKNLHFLLLLTTLFLFFNSTSAEEGNSYIAKKGILDLRDWDFNKDGNLKLNGEWEFYWDTFLMDSSLEKQSTKEFVYLEVPQIWNSHLESNGISPSHGYATYRLKILLDTKDELAIKFLNSGTSSEIFIDGISYLKSGNPAKTKENTIPSLKSAVIDFTPQNNEIEIIIQIANFHHKKGGQWEPLFIGNKENIHQFRNNRIFIELLLVGAILIMSIFHFIIYIGHRTDKASLYFAFFTLMLSLRMAVISENTIYMLSDFNWAFLLRTDYISFYLAILAFLLFLKALYPKEVGKTFSLFIIILSIIFTLLTIILPPELFSQILVIYQLTTIISATYAFHIIYKAIRKKRDGAIYFFYGFIVIFISLIHDILIVNGVLYSFPWAPYGLTIFIIFQANILASRIRNALVSNEKLSDILKTQNNQYAFLNSKYKEQNKELTLAKNKAEESDRFKSAFLANMSHEIRTPMNGIIGFADLLKNQEFSEKEREEFVEIINERSHQLLGIVNDIIDISKIETGQIDINNIETCINTVMDDIHHAYSTALDKADFKIEKSITLTNEQSTIISDNIKLRQILDNLISNAIKFTRKGKVEFGYNLKNSFLEFFVKDTGIGMTEEERNLVFGRFNQANTEISQKYGGTGLGLAIAKAYIEKIGGEIWVESEKGIGSSFYFTIPYNPVN